jgi:hypothetical protein
VFLFLGILVDMGLMIPFFNMKVNY